MTSTSREITTETRVDGSGLKEQVAQQPPLKEKNLFELDVLRVVAMGLILFAHARPYLGWDPRLAWLIPAPGGVGLSVFFFLSGFLLRRSMYGREQSFSAIAFLKSRFVRIMPLYWLSILVFVWIFHVAHIFQYEDFSPLLVTTLTHALGLQLLSAPQSVIFTIWYMGALIPYYLLFAATARLNLAKYLTVNVLLLAGLYALKMFFQQRGIALLDFRLLMHYPTLLFGVCYAEFDLNMVRVKRSRWVLCGLFSVLTLVFLQWRGSAGLDYDNALIAPANFAYYAYSMLGAVAVTGLAFAIAPLVRKYAALVSVLSVSSYAVYLFHRPVYSLLYDVIVRHVSESLVLRTLLFPLMTAVLVWICYVISRLDTQWIKPRFTSLLNR
ncbi:MAG: acyltransferase [Cyanobacteria bacterium P01_D01_bin.36]